MDSLRVSANISGTANPQFVPEEVFAATIERCLNQFEWAPLFSHKSFYSRLFPRELFPEILVHNIDGIFFDSELGPLPGRAVAALCDGFEYPVVIKPNVNSSGGAGVSSPACSADLQSEMRDRKDFVVQPVVRQHSFFEAFNPCGLNTLRIYTYRSVLTGETHVLGTTLRMGQGGSLDNETAGGIVCHVVQGDRLNGYAVDKYGRKFDKHPDTGLRFRDAGLIPNLDKLRELARFLARRLPMMRLAGWDFYMDPGGNWRCLEVNLKGHTIRFAQYAGQPFFGSFTDEVIHFCLSHPRAFRSTSASY